MRPHLSALRKMQASLGQQYMIQCCVQLGKSASEAALSSAHGYQWHKAFKEGREGIEDEQRSG